MRKKTLFGVCFIMAWAVAFLLSWFKIQLPYIGSIDPMITGIILVPILLGPMTALNTHLLKWRKAHGRDIETEEKHEFDEADIISLRPRQPHEHSSTYRRWEK